MECKTSRLEFGLRQGKAEDLKSTVAQSSAHNLYIRKTRHDAIEEQVKWILDVIQNEGHVDKQLLLDALVDLSLTQNGPRMDTIVGQVKQERLLEEDFRDDLVEACNADSTRPRMWGFQWCPIVSSWHQEN